MIGKRSMGAAVPCASRTRIQAFCSKTTRVQSRGHFRCMASHQTESTPSFFQNIATSVLAASVILTASTVPANAQDFKSAAEAVSEYAQLESQGKFNKGKALEDFRMKHNMRRGADGRLQLRSSRGEWFQVRLDMEVPGAMLLRDSKGYVFAIQTEAIQQIDLSDDMVVLMMFSDSEWEKQMSPLEFQDDKGATKQLQLQDNEFREVIGLLKEVQDLEEERQGAQLEEAK